MVTYIAYQEESFKNAAACTTGVQRQLAEGWKVSQVQEPIPGHYRVVFRHDGPLTRTELAVQAPALAPVAGVRPSTRHRLTPKHAIATWTRSLLRLRHFHGDRNAWQ